MGGARGGEPALCLSKSLAQRPRPVTSARASLASTGPWGRTPLKRAGASRFSRHRGEVGRLAVAKDTDEPCLRHLTADAGAESPALQRALPAGEPASRRRGRRGSPVRVPVSRRRPLRWRNSFHAALTGLVSCQRVLPLSSGRVTTFQKSPDSGWFVFSFKRGLATTLKRPEASQALP